MDLPPAYEADVFTWSQHQAALLRRLVGSGLALPNDLDIANIAEEIESLGRSELSSVLSHLEGMLLHLVKLTSAPDSTARRGWLEEVEEHQAQATRHFTPGMRQLVDLDKVWRRAVRRAAASLERHLEPVAVMPDALPLSLDDLLDETLRPETLAASLVQALPPPPA